MVKKAALKTAGISMSGFQARPKVFDGQTPSQPPSPAAGSASSPARSDAPRDTPRDAPPDGTRDPVRPFTGVGSVMAAITREAEISQQLVGAQARLDKATARLAEFDGASLVRTLDARAVRRSPWANRIEAEFGTPEFLQLKEEIANAGGNVQPIQVRPIPGVPDVFDGQTPIYEIAYGHRRHQACLELGLPVNAVVASGMDDAALFEAMDRENRSRKNLSAWEQGRMYEQAIRQGLYASLRKLADALGVNLSDASRAVQLAKLPREIVSAFGSPLDLQVRWAKPLADALQRDPDGVLVRARACADQPGPRVATDVYQQLLGLAPKAQATDTVIADGSRRLAVLRTDARGRAVVEFEPGVLDGAQHKALALLLQRFLADQGRAG